MVDDTRGGRTRPTHLLAALERLDLRIGAALAGRMRATGLELRGSEGRILNLIGPDGTRPTALAEGAWITKQAVGKRLRGLEDRGLVAIGPDPDDARAVLVRLTAAGRRARDVAVQQIAALEDELAEAVGRQRYRAFREVLDELGGSVDV